jgi:hypothetical protein
MRWLIIFTIAFLSCKSGSRNNTEFDSTPGMVYVCISRTAYAYHIDFNCRGLRECTHRIIEVDLVEAAETMRRKPCGYCTK